MDSISCDSIINHTMDNLRSDSAVDKAEQLMVLRLNTQPIPEIASLKSTPVPWHID